MHQQPARAVIIADVRTGGHFLTSCLSMHPQIFCVREEPFHKKSAWKPLGRGPATQLIWSQHYYDVCMFKCTPSQIFPGKHKLWKIIVKSGAKIIYLKRENMVEQAISDAINRARKEGHPAHRFSGDLSSSVSPPPVFIAVDEAKRSMRGLLQRARRTETLIRRAPVEVLNLTYEELIDPDEFSTEIPESTGDRICSFLGVLKCKLWSRMEKVHRAPYIDFVSNWEEIKKCLRAMQQ
jgi:hypothetical protein